MNFLDVRTALIGGLIMTAVSTSAIGYLWLQHRRHAQGLGYWLADFLVQCVALAVIVLRGVIPETISIMLGTPLVVGGTILLYVGLLRYSGRPGPNRLNLLLLAAVVAAQAWFTFVHPSLQARNIVLSAALLVICLQCSWLMLRATERENRASTSFLGLVFVAFCIVSALRILLDLSVPPGDDLFASGSYIASVLLVYQGLFLGLAFGLLVMVSRRLQVSLQQDIEVRRQTEAALRQSEAKFALAFQQAPYAITITREEDGQLVEVNEAFYKMTGLTREQTTASTTLGLDLWVDPEERNRVIRVLRGGREVVGEEMQFRRKNGEVLSTLFSAGFVRLNAERLILSSINDITERKRAEDQIRKLNSELDERVRDRTRALEEANRELAAQQSALATQAEAVARQNVVLEQQKHQVEEANRAKTSFLATMSHELRTPLNSVIALSGVLSRRLAGSLPEEEHSYLEVIARNGKHLLALINDILDFARIETGREEVTLERFSVPKLATELVQMLEPQAREKRIALVSTMPEDLPLLLSDRLKCRHILQNLLANAVKFTESGRVEVIAAATGNGVRIEVVDTGVGIAEDRLDLIFEEFRQADESTARKYGGTGLGLAIARKYASLLQGTIEVKSTPGKGSTFTLTLPLIFTKTPHGASDGNP